jgi:hypothetical protein
MRVDLFFVKTKIRHRLGKIETNQFFLKDLVFDVNKVTTYSNCHIPVSGKTFLQKQRLAENKRERERRRKRLREISSLSLSLFP